MRVKDTKYLEEKILTKIKGLIILSEYKNSRTKLYVVDKYSIYLTTPHNLLAGRRPGIQTALNKNLYFKNRATETHKNKYDYTKCDYKGSKTKLIIICSIHGEFKQTPNRHLMGDGCPYCKSYTSGWNKHKFVNKSINAICYIINCYNETESFYKIGITTKSVKERFKKNNMPYNYKIISEFRDISSNVWEKEKILHKINKNNKYIPKIKFGGMHECFIKIEKYE